MKKIKITEQQAKMLKDLGKTKVLKITKEQYDRILKLERLNEMDLSSPITREFNKNLSKGARKDFENTKLHGIDEMYESFINELYGITESDPIFGESNFKKLAKLMESAGLINNNRIVKEKFHGDKNVVKHAISEGLYEMLNGGSVYKAMERIEEAISSDDIVSTLRKQLTPSPDRKKSSPEEIKAKLANIRARELDRRDKEDNEFNELLGEVEGQNIVGLDILNHEPFASLPQSRDINNMRRDVNMPSVQDGDVTLKMMEKDAVESWIAAFKKKFNEEPIFQLNPDAPYFDQTKVLNEPFIAWQNRYVQGKADALKGWGTTDETTTASSSGAFVGKMGGSVNEPNVADELINDEVSDEIDDNEIYEQGIGSVGAYDTPGFTSSEFMGTKGKSGKAPVKTSVKPYMKGAKEVKIKDKCKVYPYCNQGPDAIE